MRSNLGYKSLTKREPHASQQICQKPVVASGCFICTANVLENHFLCCTEGWKVALVESRFTHPAESRYAPVEGEALAVADALDKGRHSVLGCTDLVVTVDHKPLIGLFTNRSLDNIPNNRPRNLKESTLRYRFTMQHVPGLKDRAPDALSRHPTGVPKPAQLRLPDDISFISANASEG